MREADIDDMGIKIGGRDIINLIYADGTGLMADNITSMYEEFSTDKMLQGMKQASNSKPKRPKSCIKKD